MQSSSVGIQSLRSGCYLFRGNMADEQEQADEIMALQSIYEDDTFICNASKKPFNGKISIFLDPDSEDHEFMCNGTVVPLRHLSPLILNFSLPSNYPSESPPSVTLSCFWLTAQQLEMLSNKLNEKWAENCGNVVLFTWIDFLKSEAIEFLGIKFPVDVSEEKIMKLTEQSILRDEEIFRRGLHYCPVCLAEKSGNQCVRLSICGHVFCKGCLSGFLSVYIQEGSVNAINCPCEECDEQLYPNIIKSLVSQTDFERYDRLLLQNTLDVMPDIKYCPRIQCQKPVVVDKDDSVGFCYACNFAFCTKCKLTYHGIEKCKWERDLVNKNTMKDRDPQEYFRQWDYWSIPEDERMRLATEYMDGDDEVREGLEEYYGKERMMDMLVDWQAQKWIKANTKKCPKCSTNIEKSYGCNKMICVKCGTRFCWACSREIKSKNPYDHFSDPSSPCYNNLADVEQVREEDDEAEHGNLEMVDA